MNGSGPGGIRTLDPRLKRPSLYLAELRAPERLKGCGDLNLSPFFRRERLIVILGDKGEMPLSVLTLYAFSVGILPYITIIIFLMGVILRAFRWLSAPRGESPPLSATSAIKYIILDIVLFRKIYKHDKVMWLLIFLFHMAAASIIFGHMRGFKLWSAELFVPLGEGFKHFLVETLPIYMGYLFIATQILLLFRRILLEGKKLLSHPNDYAALLLLLATSIAGQGMRIAPPEMVNTTYTVSFIPRLVVLHLEKIPSAPWFLLHIILTQLFFMYIPYSKLIHIYSGVITAALYGSRRSEYGL